MNSTSRRCAFGAVLAGLTLPVATAGAGTPEKILDGPLAAGGSFSLAAERRAMGGIPGLCLHLQPTFADGSTSGTATGCAFGSLSARDNVFTVTGTSHAGSVQTSYLVGGVVAASGRARGARRRTRAHVVRIAFADGKRKRIRPRPAPRALRRTLGRALGARVRYFGADVLSLTSAKVRSVSVYDRDGRRIARSAGVQG